MSELWYLKLVVSDGATKFHLFRYLYLQTDKYTEINLDLGQSSHDAFYSVWKSRVGQWTVLAPDSDLPIRSEECRSQR